MSRRSFVFVVIAVMLFSLVPPVTAQEEAVVTWWSHWANEPNKREVVETFVADYMEAHPNVTIVLEWWDKPELYQALRSTLAAGEGFPDIFTMDPADPGVDWVNAGWVLNLDPYVDWDAQMDPVGADQYRYEGHEGTYGIAVEFLYDIIVYNEAVFDELGIQVPDDYTFTFDEWVDVMNTCAASEYAPIADAIGTDDYFGRWPFLHALLAYAGPDDFSLYMRGLKNWDTPEARQALERHIELSAIPIWPDAFPTMTLDEFHAFFNNQEAACAMYLATWYTGRAFQAPDSGGQAEGFAERTGLLRPVFYEDAEYNGLSQGFVGSGYAGAAMTAYPDVVGDVLSSLAAPKYGALWVGKTASPTSILYDPADVETEYKWYFDLLNEVYGDVEVVAPDVTVACSDIAVAISDVIGQGIPLGVITDVDEAIEQLNAALCEGAE